jgi:hypothetical protein
VLEGVRQLILGSVFSNSGHEVRAKDCYLKAIKHGEAGADLHAAAFAAYELGMLLCKTPEVSNAYKIIVNFVFFVHFGKAQDVLNVYKLLLIFAYC